MDPDKIHAAEVNAGYKAWVEGVRDGRGLYELVGDILRAAEAVRFKASVKDRDESNHS